MCVCVCVCIYVRVYECVSVYYSVYLYLCHKCGVCGLTPGVADCTAVNACMCVHVRASCNNHTCIIH